jgi:hypothetical protein
MWPRTPFARLARLVHGLRFGSVRELSASRIRSARWRMRNRIARHPRLFLRTAGFSDAQADEWLIGRHKALCIDGYPRSATTFAVAAFQLAQPRPVQVAHHSHAPAQLITAARWNIPSLVTIRAPEDSVLSTTIYFPYLTVETALRSYVEFYEAVQTYRDAFVVGEFGDITSRFDLVIRRVNERFGCDFAEYVNSPENDDIVFSVINQGDESSRANPFVTSFFSGGMDYRELRELLQRRFDIDLDPDAPARQSTVARPSADRERMKATLRLAYQDGRLAALRARAAQIYDELASDRAGAATPAAGSARTSFDAAPRQ